MAGRGRALGAAALAAASLALGVPSAAAHPGDDAEVGYDVSYPQCDDALPDDPAFAVVGVNGGLATRPNPCLAEQLAWAAERTTGADVGLYSTGHQWRRITGVVPEDSPLHDLDSWLAGARSLAGARAACLRDPLVDGGDVVLTQYVVDRLDHDHSCPAERPWRRPLSGPD